MRKIIAIASKELQIWFRSPMAYIILSIMFIIFNVSFFVIIDENREAQLRDMFTLMEFLFLFFIPLLMMKSFSEEKSSQTMEFLLTTPTRPLTIILGKYAGGLIFLSLIIVLTFVYYVILAIFSRPDLSASLTGYAGLWLEGAFFMAVGLLTSSWTRNQILAAINAYGILFLLYFLLNLTKYAQGNGQALIKAAGILTHSKNFFVGIITLSDIVYFLSAIAVCILLTRVSLETKIWDHI